MDGEQDAVAAFHTKYGFRRDKSLKNDTGITASHTLMEVSTQVARIAVRLLHPAVRAQARDGDDRMYRLHLILEEASEVAEALADGDEIALADALGDLLYVLIGTAATYDIPLSEVFDEIHRSNMTKTRDSDDPRMKRGKSSESFSPPNIERAVQEGRERLRYRESLPQG